MSTVAIGGWRLSSALLTMLAIIINILLLGGTADITVHEVVKGGIKEVARSDGVPTGGNSINDKLESLLRDTLSNEFVDHLIHNQPSEWYELMFDFERGKRNLDTESDKPISMSISLGLWNCYKEYQESKGKSGDIKAAFSGENGLTIDENSKLCLDRKILREIYGEIITEICKKVVATMTTCADNMTFKPKCIYLVGGFAECAFVQNEFKKLEPIVAAKFHCNCVVLIPHEASLCVLKGALIFGHNPNVVKSRITRYSLAFQLIDQNQRPIEQIMEVGTPITEKFYAKREIELREATGFIRIEFYRSIKQSIASPTESGVEKVGSLSIDAGKVPSKDRQKIYLEFILSSTEFDLRVIGAHSNEKLMGTSFSLGENKSSWCLVM